MNKREFIVVLLLGVFIGTWIGVFASMRYVKDEIIPIYCDEVKRVESWHKVLLNTITGQGTVPEKKQININKKIGG